MKKAGFQISNLKSQKRLILGFIFAFCLFTFAFQIYFAHAQSGVLLPVSTSKTEIEPLEIQTMNVSVLIDNQHATVKIVQIFDNQTDETLEGKYLFALPTNSSIFDFAVWDADLRIPGVMMEKTPHKSDLRRDKTKGN